MILIFWKNTKLKLYRRITYKTKQQILSYLKSMHIFPNASNEMFQNSFIKLTWKHFLTLMYLYDVISDTYCTMKFNCKCGEPSNLNRPWKICLWRWGWYIGWCVFLLILPLHCGIMLSLNPISQCTYLNNDQPQT